ncbi:MAG: ABC transporter permease [Acidimicrobiia bacterium]|nr:ABC transporter permease [Acidimicrobiia bacterium]
MKDWTLLRVIIGREYRAWKKPFLISSAIIFVVVAAALTIASVAADQSSGPATQRVGTAGTTPPTFAREVMVFVPDEIVVEFVPFATAAAAEAALRDGDINVAAIDDDTIVWGDGVQDPVGDGIYRAFANAQARQQASELGISASDLERLLTPRIDFREANPMDPEDSSEADEAIAVIATIAMFGAILAYGQWIGYAVVEEKANRVVEVLLGAIRPHQLMGAKVFSIGSLGLAQITGVGLLALGYGIVSDGIGLPSARGTTVFWVVLWFLLGYAFYGSLYAAAGSLGSNTQEAGSTMGPLAIFLVIGYMVGLVSFGEGFDTVFLQVISFIPLWAPLVLPGRIVRGWAAPWEVALALVIMIAGIYGMLRLAGWIYTGGVARATQKLGWREALRAGRELGAD